MDYFFHEICDRVESYSVVRYNVFRNSTRSRRKLVSAALYPWRVRRTRPGSVENRQRWHSTETETVMGFSSGIEGKRQLQMPSFRKRAEHVRRIMPFLDGYDDKFHSAIIASTRAKID